MHGISPRGVLSRLRTKRAGRSPALHRDGRAIRHLQFHRGGRMWNVLPSPFEIEMSSLDASSGFTLPVEWKKRTGRHSYLVQWEY